jgi:hypothetical protein
VATVVIVIVFATLVWVAILVFRQQRIQVLNYNTYFNNVAVLAGILTERWAFNTKYG